MNKTIDTTHNMRDMWGDKVRPQQAAESYFKDHPDKRYVIVDGTMDTVVFVRWQGQALHGDFIWTLRSNRRIWRARRDPQPKTVERNILPAWRR